MTALVNQIGIPGLQAPGLAHRDYPPTLIASGAIVLTTTPTSVTIFSPFGGLPLVAAAQTGSFNAAWNTAILVDCTAGVATATLTAGPTAGNQMMFFKFGTFSFTISLNGLLWYGTSINPVTTGEGWESLVYTGATRGVIDQ